MYKKILFVPITVMLLLSGCQNATPTNTAQTNGQTPLVTATTNSAGAKSPEIAMPAETITPTTKITPSDAIDYNQYIKKVWVLKNDKDNYLYPSFSISKIVNGQITGIFSLSLEVPSNHSFYGHLTGTINKDTAECQFEAFNGVKGNIKLVFKTNDEMEATFEYPYTKIELVDFFQAKERTTYQYIPYNINNLDGFTLIESQSFMVDLNSWGNVKFVSGKFIGASNKSVLFYLTDKNGNILNFFEIYPADIGDNIDIKAVSFQDVNEDGLKDIIIIVEHNIPASPGEKEATVYFQKADGTFTNDDKLEQEINESGNNKDIKTVVSYLSKNKSW